MMRRKKLLCISMTIALLLTGCGSSKKESVSYDKANMEMTDCEIQSCNEEFKITNDNFNTEEYDTIQENRFLSVKNNALSTFSADVDTASYSNVRRMIKEGYVDRNAIRTEEFINYFHYDYAKPENDNPFQTTTEIMDCPWNKDTKLLSIGIKAKDMDYENLPDSNIVFLLDVSGSMNSPDKLPLMIKAFKMLSEHLNSRDRISIVTYAGSDQVLLEGCDGNDQYRINSALENVMAGGGTNGSAGIETAYKLAEKYYIKGGNNRVILATDGDLNIGLTSESELDKLIRKKAKSGVFLSVLGLGTGNIKDNKMETLADNGNGNYSYIDSILEAKKVLVEEMGGTLFTVAKDVKFQVEFNPAKLKGYRLIGYENRLLNAEDFEDDTKDAGEIGAGHCVTALYEFVPIDSKMDIKESDLKYQDSLKTSDSASDEWLTVNIRYKEPDSDSSQLLTYPVTEVAYSANPSDDLRFASCVAEFAMLLRESEYVENGNYEHVISRLEQIDNIENDPYKTELLELVKMAKELE